MKFGPEPKKFPQKRLVLKSLSVNRPKSIIGDTAMKGGAMKFAIYEKDR